MDVGTLRKIFEEIKHAEDVLAEAIKRFEEVD